MKKIAIKTPTPLAALSHEFRTPLNGVLGMARLLEGTRLTAEQKSYVAALKECGDHLLTLVNDVLDLAKLDAGALTLNLASLRMETLLESVAELLSPRAHAKGLEIAWTAPVDLPAVFADQGRLKQVLFNLAGNAIKFTDQGGVILGVEWAGAPGGKTARLRLTVRDTGPGVAKERQQKIFEAFTHADARDGARDDSAGLGLAIVSRLAEAHGGAVGVDSTPGQGATFWFEAEFDVQRPPQGRLPLMDLCVVIASPSAIVREAAASQVRSCGGQAITFESLEEAARQSPRGAVVLIDQAFANPGRRVRPVPGRPSLILLPPEARGHIPRIRGAGFAGYLIKPLRTVSLADRVLAALGRHPSGAPSRADERAEHEAAKGARVLVVEDNPINALLARKLLEREGCDVDQAATGQAAIDAAAMQLYDLILMDRRLPDIDGLTATQFIRAAGSTTPIVALTADAFEDDRRACLEAGMNDFLTKPLDPGALRTVLARAQDGRLAGGWTKPAGTAKLAS